MQNAKTEAQSASQDVVKLKMERERHIQEIARLRSQVSELPNLEESITRLRNEKQKAEQDAASAVQTVEDLKMELESQAEEIAQLNLAAVVSDEEEPSSCKADVQEL